MNAEIIDVLRRSECSGSRLDLPSDLSTTTYREAARVIGDLGGEYRKGPKAHFFPGREASEVLAHLLTPEESTAPADEPKPSRKKKRTTKAQAQATPDEPTPATEEAPAEEPEPTTTTTEPTPEQEAPPAPATPPPAQVLASVEVEAAHLRASLRMCRDMADMKSTIPVLHCVRLDIAAISGELTAETTDLDRRFTTVIDTVRFDGAATTVVNLKGLLTILGTFSAKKGVTIQLEIAAGQLVLRQGTETAQIATWPAEDFPSVPEHGRPDETLILSLDALQAGLARVTHAVSAEESRFQLNGALFNLEGTANKLTLVGTDGHRLALAEVPLERRKTRERKKETDETSPQGRPGWYIVDGPALRFLETLPIEEGESVRVHLSKEYARFDVEGASLGCRNQQGTFPDYERVIMKDPAQTVRADTAVLHAAAKAFVAAKMDTVRLTFEGDAVQLRWADAEGNVVDRQVPLLSPAEPLTLGVNSHYLTEALSAVPENKVELCLKTAEDQFQIRPVGAAERHDQIIMPKRI